MMRTFCGLAVLALLMGGCLKSNTKATIKADASGTMSYDAAYQVEAVESARERIDQMQQRMEEAGRETTQADEAKDRLKKFVRGFEPDQVTSDLKARGLEVSTVKPYEKDGWKGVTVEATFKDVNVVLAKIREKREAERAAAQPEEPPAGEEGGGGRRRGGGMGRFTRGLDLDASPVMVSAFQKTGDPKIGKALLTLPRDVPPGGRPGGPGGRGARGGFGGAGMGMEDFRRTLRLTLPGKIVEATNCKKEDDNTVVLDLKGSDLTPDEEGNMPVIVTAGAWLTFEIPDGCAIQFDDPAPSKDDKKPATPEEGEKKKRKGDLKIGGEGGGG